MKVFRFCDVIVEEEQAHRCLMISGADVGKQDLQSTKV